MAVSGTISATAFDTRRVIDTAFRRCRLPAQAITAEMQNYAQDALYLFLSDLANGKTPSWCIEKLILPFTLNNPEIVLPVGTVGVLNVVFRLQQTISPVLVVDTATEHRVDFTEETRITTIGVTWAATPVELTVEVSDDELVWVQVAVQPVGTAVSGDIVWFDFPGLSARYMRVTGSAITADFAFQQLPQEVPLGPFNRDTYAAIPNKTFTSRQPTSFWFQRDRLNPILHLWPVPNVQAMQCQIVVWRHRHIMDVGTLRQDIEVPQRWMEAIIDGLAARLAAETAEVDLQLVPMLEGRAAQRLQSARDGDNDGSPTYIQPAIACYTA